MSSKSAHFAATVLAAFEAAGAVTDAEVGQGGGPSTTTMTKLRKAAAGEILMVEPRNDTYRRIETVAGWEPGSARALWRDGIQPKPRRLTGLGDLGFKAAQVTPAGIDGYLQTLADRITELEERVDLLEATGGRASERANQPDLVLDQPDGSKIVVEAKGVGAVGRAAASQGALYFVGGQMFSELAKGYVGALVVASHENPVVAGALNERLAQHGRVDEQLAEQARSVIGAVRALEDPRVVLEVLVEQLESARRGLSDEDRAFLDEIAATMPESDLGDNQDRLPTAARKMTSAGRRARAAQDQAGEENQDQPTSYGSQVIDPSEQHQPAGGPPPPDDTAD